MALTLTRSFNPNMGEIIIGAYARCGIRRTEITQQHMADAQFEGNLLQSDMQGDGINLYQVVLQTQDLIPGKGQYFIDPTMVFMLDVYIRQNNYSNIPIGVQWENKTPYVDSWVNDNNTTMIWINTPNITPVPQTADWVNNGYVQTDWINRNAYITPWGLGGQAPSPSPIPVPIETQVYWINRNFVETDWTNNSGGKDFWSGASSPTPPVPPVPPTPPTPTPIIPPGPTYQLNSGVTDRIIIPMSRSDYAATANKGMTGFPTSFWLDKLLQPVMYLWPIPNVFVPQGLQYYIQQRPTNVDTSNGSNVEIPYEYFDFYTWSLAERLAYIYAPERVAVIGPRKQAAYMKAMQASTENVPLNLDTEMRSYFRIG
jgi:hypothetical protein